jgi:hypothetical protein
MRKKCCIQLSHPTAWLGWLQVAQQPRAQLHVGLPQKRRIHSGGADRAANVHGALCEFARHGYRHWCEETWRDEPLPCHGVLYYRVQVTGLALACPTARLTQSATDSRLTRALGTGAGRLGTRCLIDLGWCRRVWVRVHWEAVWSLQREAQCLLALTVGWQKGRRRRSGEGRMGSASCALGMGGCGQARRAGAEGAAGSSTARTDNHVGLTMRSTMAAAWAHHPETEGRQLARREAWP